MAKHKKENKKLEKHPQDKKRKMSNKDLEKVSGGAATGVVPLGERQSILLSE
jgi:prolyl-tRNA editing enzyme YbaK/EbsC (Cys-tRNA(Pro) deacylase)